jgi:hypothetical protein
MTVIVSPHGIRGRLTGCCPSDLVKQVYFRYFLFIHFYTHNVSSSDVKSISLD